jgi:capsular polysaccharide biosynthesis protein
MLLTHFFLNKYKKVVVQSNLQVYQALMLNTRFSGTTMYPFTIIWMAGFKVRIIVANLAPMLRLLKSGKLYKNDRSNNKL